MSKSDDYILPFVISILAVALSLAGIILPLSEDSFIPSGAKACLTSHQVVSSGAWVTVQLTNEFFDDNNEFNTTTYTFTANYTGRYMVVFLVKFYPIDDQNYGAMRLHRNSAVSVAESFEFMSYDAVGSLYMSAVAFIQLSENDTIVLQCSHNQAGTVYVIAEEGVTALTIYHMN